MKINQREIEKAMKRMGIQSVQVEATEVIIRTEEKDIVLSSPSVTKVNMGGQVSYQIAGDEVERSRINIEDVKMIVQQTSCSEEDAKKALEETGDLAEAILRLKK